MLRKHDFMLVLFIALSSWACENRTVQIGAIRANPSYFLVLPGLEWVHV